LGGAKRLPLSDGGIIPKSYYMSMEDFEKDQSPGPHLEDSTYSSTTCKFNQMIE